MSLAAFSFLGRLCNLFELLCLGLLNEGAEFCHANLTSTTGQRKTMDAKFFCKLETVRCSENVKFCFRKS
jgi:hypothetical protein